MKRLYNKKIKSSLCRLLSAESSHRPASAELRENRVPKFIYFDSGFVAELADNRLKTNRIDWNTSQDKDTVGIMVNGEPYGSALCEISAR